MSLSSAAKHNIAVGAMVNYVADRTNLTEAATLLATSIIEREIGFASEDLSPELFTELVAEILDPILGALYTLGA